MNIKSKLLSLCAVLALAVSSAPGQTVTTVTTTSSAVSATDQVVNLTSATGVTAAGSLGNFTTLLFIDKELMGVLSITSTAATVQRGLAGSVVAHVSGSKVWAGAPNFFANQDPTGACTSAQQVNLPRPSTATGNVFSCVNGQWGTYGVQTAIPVLGAVLASAVTMAPVAPLFHTSGTAAIVTITVPAGLQIGQSFTMIPDAVCTWTAAGNIAIAGSCVVNKALTFVWDGTKWTPSYIA